jgi:hypothetical protein
MDSLRVALEEAGKASRSGSTSADIELPPTTPRHQTKGGGTTRAGTA